MAEEITISENTGLLFIEERGKAILVEQNKRRIFLPRSQVSYMRKGPVIAGMTPLTIRIPVWLADEKNLSDK